MHRHLTHHTTTAAPRHDWPSGAVLQTIQAGASQTVTTHHAQRENHYGGRAMYAVWSDGNWCYIQDVAHFITVYGQDYHVTDVDPEPSH